MVESFLNALSSVCQQSNIKSAFRKTGIVHLNTQEVLNSEIVIPIPQEFHIQKQN